MVTFVTLILSLISGVLPVEVAVDGPVARVELVLSKDRVYVEEPVELRLLVRLRQLRFEERWVKDDPFGARRRHEPELRLI